MSTTVRSISIALLFASAASSSALTFRTINLDFGNGPAYVGDDGVLSSPGGDFWNRITTDDLNASLELLDEFGQSLGLEPTIPRVTPTVFSMAYFSPGLGLDVDDFVGAGAGPMSDGVVVRNLEDFGLLSGILIREFAPNRAVELVVYFGRPGSEPSVTSTIVSGRGNPLFGFSPGVVVESISVSDAFPGVPGQDHALFDPIFAGFTTIGVPAAPGVGVGVRSDEVAYITAIQVRGFFEAVPEPASSALLLIVVAPLAVRNRG